MKKIAFLLLLVAANLTAYKSEDLLLTVAGGSYFCGVVNFYKAIKKFPGFHINGETLLRLFRGTKGATQFTPATFTLNEGVVNFYKVIKNHINGETLLRLFRGTKGAAQFTLATFTLNELVNQLIREDN